MIARMHNMIFDRDVSFETSLLDEFHRRLTGAELRSTLVLACGHRYHALDCARRVVGRL